MEKEDKEKKDDKKKKDDIESEMTKVSLGMVFSLLTNIGIFIVIIFYFLKKNPTHKSLPEIFVLILKVHLILY